MAELSIKLQIKNKISTAFAYNVSTVGNFIIVHFIPEGFLVLTGVGSVVDDILQ